MNDSPASSTAMASFRPVPVWSGAACLLVLATVFWLFFWPTGARPALVPFQPSSVQAISYNESTALVWQFEASAHGLAGLVLPAAETVARFPRGSVLELELRELYTRRLVGKARLAPGGEPTLQALEWRFGRRWLSAGVSFELRIRALPAAEAAALPARAGPAVPPVREPVQGLPASPALETRPLLILAQAPAWMQPPTVWAVLAGSAGLALACLAWLVWRVLPAGGRDPWLICLLAAVAVLPAGLALPADDECLWIDIVSLSYHVKALWSGAYPFWNPLLGLGQPHPLGQVMLNHPLALLAGMLPWATVLSLFYFTHYIIALLGMRAFCREVGLSRPAVWLAVISYGLASPAIQYVFIDFWPEFLLHWSLLPILAWLLVRLMAAPDAPAKALTALLLGLLAWLDVSNGHPSVTLIHALGLACFLLGYWRRLPGALPWLSLTLAVFAGLEAPRLFDLLSEYRRFPPGLPRAQDFLELTLLGLFLWPISSYDNSALRDVIFGGPMAALALSGLWGLGSANPHRLPLALGLAGCLLFWVGPWQGLDIISTNWHVRDPLILFACALGGLMWDRLRARLPRARWLWAAVAAAQVLVMLVGWAHFWQREIERTKDYFQGQPDRSLPSVLDKSPLVMALEDLGARQGGRCYLSPRAENYLGRLMFRGYHTSSPPLHGLRMVNGLFKGIEYGDIYPNFGKMYGQVAASPRVLLDKPLLDVLGIRFLVADPEEKVAQGLEPALRLPYSSKKRPPLVLYVNPGAWPDAVVLAPGAREYPLPLLPDCGHEALMCRDFSGLAAMRLPGESVEARWEPGGDLELSLPPAPRPRLVLVNQAYRQGWRAGWRGSGGQGQTEVFVLAGGLTGLEVPPGAELVRLEFRPAPRLLLYGLSWVLLAAVAASVVALALLGHRARLRGRRPDRDLANSPAQGR